MSRSLVAGVDCSTQATKVVVVDVDSGKIVADGRSPHEVSGSHGARETHPEVWWEALKGALAGTGLSEEIAAISIAGQQHGLVCLDGNGDPLRPALLWNDTRSAADAEHLVDALGGPRAWADDVGVVPVASFTVSKWAWVTRLEPEVRRATRAIRLPHDYVTERLAGVGVTDRGDGSGTGWWSTRTESYEPAVLGLPAVDLDPELLPRVLGPLEPAGEVGATGSAIGLRPGTLVGCGTGDNMGAALGLGLEEGTPVLSLGTSGTAYTVMSQRTADETGIVAGFADATGRYLPLACTLNATQAVDTTAAWLGIGRDEVAPASGEVVVLPYFDGERTPNFPRASATFTGLRHGTDPGQILRAAYEGCVASLLEALDHLAEHGSGIDPSAPLILIGGGAAGATWQEVVRRLSGRAVQIPQLQELVAVGAAAQAAALLESEPPDRIARRWGTTAGATLDAVEPDLELLGRIRGVRTATDELNAR
jgi:xylulokinase